MKSSHKIFSFILLLSLMSSVPVFAVCTDEDGDGYFRETDCGTLQDCNDAYAGTNPGAFEICDGYDNNCDGQIDNDPACDRTCNLPEKIGDDIRVTNDPANRYYPSLVWTGSEYGLVWEDERGGNKEIYFARIDAMGRKICDDVQVAEGYRVPSLVWTGSEYGVSFPSNRSGGRRYYFTRLDAAGQKIGEDVKITHDYTGNLDQDLVWTGSEYGFAWIGSGDPEFDALYFVRLDKTGQKIGDLVLVAQYYDDVQFDLTWTGSEFGFAWVGFDDTFHFSRLDATGQKIGDDVLVDIQGNMIGELTMVWTGSEYGVAWSEESNAGILGFGICFVRLDSTGAKIGNRILLSTDPREAVSPSLTWTGSEYGISWSYFTQISPHWIADIPYFARIDATGQKIGDDVLVRDPLRYGGGQDSSLVWTGFEYGVVWNDYHPNEIYFARIGCITIDDILNFFDESVIDGTLEGVGSGKSANNRLKAFRKMLVKAGQMIDKENLNAASNKLNTIYKKCDSQPKPKDFVAGEAAPELANMILDLMESLECE